MDKHERVTLGNGKGGSRKQTAAAIAKSKKRRESRSAAAMDKKSADFLEAVTGSGDMSQFSDLQQAAAKQLKDKATRNEALARIVGAPNSKEGLEMEDLFALRSAPPEEQAKHLRMSVPERIDLLMEHKPEVVAEYAKQMLASQQMIQACHILMSTATREMNRNARELLEATYGANEPSSIDESGVKSNNDS